MVCLALASLSLALLPSGVWAAPNEAVTVPEAPPVARTRAPAEPSPTEGTAPSVDAAPGDPPVASGPPAAEATAPEAAPAEAIPPSEAAEPTAAAGDPVPTAEPPAGDPAPTESTVAASPEDGSTAPATTDVAAPPPVLPATATPPPEVVDVPPRVLPPPRMRGTGMFIGAAAVGAIGAGFRLDGTFRALRILREGGNEWCTGQACALGAMFGGATIGTPLLLVSAGLLGGGMGMRGRWRAHEELFGNTPRFKKPTGKMPIHAALGWGMFGGGVGLWAVSRLIGWQACETVVCQVGTWESTFYISGAMIITGMVFGPYASAHANYTKRYRLLVESASLVPMIGPSYAGLSYGGRF